MYIDTGDPKPPMPASRPLEFEPVGERESEEEYVQAFLDLMGAEGRDSFVWRDVLGKGLPLSDNLFRVGTEKGKGDWKITKNGRHEYLHLLAETLLDPDEIWLTIYRGRKKSKPRLRRRYIRVFPQDEGEQGLGVFEFGKDGWKEITLFNVTEKIARDHGYESALDYLETQRIGVRIYSR